MRQAGAAPSVVYCQGNTLPDNRSPNETKRRHNGSQHLVIGTQERARPDSGQAPRLLRMVGGRWMDGAGMAWGEGRLMTMSMAC